MDLSACGLYSSYICSASFTSFSLLHVAHLLKMNIFLIIIVVNVMMITVY